MKLTKNKLKHLIVEVLEEASKDAPYGPYGSSIDYIRAQRASKLDAKQSKNLRNLDDTSSEMSRIMDQSLGLDHPEPAIKTPVEILKRQQEFRDIIANQSFGAFSESGEESSTKVKTPAIGDAYKIGTWNTVNHSGSIFANRTGIYILEDDGEESYFTPTRGHKIVPITKDWNEQAFIMFEGRER